jgi:PhoD related phosphatase
MFQVLSILCRLQCVEGADFPQIIDGFGSYVSDFMKCDVFRGIGGTAYKYYMLFQHHLPPPVSTYTTGISIWCHGWLSSNEDIDAPQTMEAGTNGVGVDPEQLKNTFVLQGQEEEPSYIIGSKPGPYVAEHSRSIYARLGARMAFFGIDARTERTRHQVNYPETYLTIFERLRKELRAAAESSNPIQHLIILLGIPIAYPVSWHHQA